MNFGVRSGANAGSRRVTLLLGVCCALCVFLTAFLAQPSNVSPLRDDRSLPSTAAVSLEATKRFKARPISAYGSYLHRPLFARSRRPEQSVPTQVESRSIKHDAEAAYTLLGVMLTGRTRLALIRTHKLPVANWLSEGTEIGAWKITSISNNAVTLSSGDKTRELFLYAGSNN